MHQLAITLGMTGLQCFWWFYDNNNHVLPAVNNSDKYAFPLQMCDWVKVNKQY